MNKAFWLRKIDPLLQKLDEIPLIRGEPFSFEDLSQKLSEKLSLSIEVTTLTKSWQKDEGILSSFPHAVQLCFTFSPLIGNVYFFMSQDDVEKITALCLTKNIEKKFASASLKEGFYRYLSLLVLENLQKSKTFENLSFKLVEGALIKSKEALCLDIKISIENHIFFGRLALTSDFRKSWNEYFSLKESIDFDEMKKLLEVPIQIILGHVTLKKSEIEELKEGDFVALDKSYADLKEDSSNVLLALQKIPLFHAKLKKNKLQILDVANYHEENIMEDKLETNEKPNEEMKIEEEEEGEVTLQEEPSSPLADIPLELTVELCKISMTLEKLMQLQSGNFLDLKTSLDNPVNVTINGKKIAKAELTTLGETLGIRILEI